MIAMPFPEAFRHQQFHWSAQQFNGLVAKKVPSLSVHQDDLASLIGDDHGVRC